MNFQKTMNEKQVVSFKPVEKTSHISLVFQSQVTGIGRTSSYAENKDLEIEFSNLNISSLVPPEISSAGSLKLNARETDSIDFDKQQKTAISIDTNELLELEESDYKSPLKTVKKCIENQTKSLVESYKAHTNKRLENSLKNDVNVNSPKFQNSACFQSPSLVHHDLIVPASVDKSAPHIVCIRKVFYDDALLSRNVKTKHNEEFFQSLTQSESEADFEQNDLGGFMQDENINTSDEMFCYSVKEISSGESPIISEVETGKTPKDSSPAISPFCNEESSPNLSGESYYTPCKNNSYFMQERGLYRSARKLLCEKSILGKSSNISKVETDEIVKNSPSCSMENQREEISSAVKEVKNGLQNINFLQESTTKLTKEVRHFSSEKNNSFIFSQGETNNTSECDIENETVFNEKVTATIKKLDFINTDFEDFIPRENANLSEELCHSTPEKNKPGDSLINSGDKTNKIFNDAHQYDFESEHLLNNEETSISILEKQISFIRPEIVDTNKAADKSIDKIINPIHYYDLKNETKIEEIRTEEERVDFFHPEMEDIHNITDNCIVKIFADSSLCNLENEMHFAETAEIGKIESDINKTDSQSSIIKNASSLDGESYHLALAKNKPDHSAIYTSDKTNKSDMGIECILKSEETNVTEEKEIDFMPHSSQCNLENEKHFAEAAAVKIIKSDINNTDSRSSVIENVTSLDGEFYHFAHAKNKPDHSVIHSSDETNKHLSKKSKTNSTKYPVKVSNTMSKCAVESSSTEVINQPVNMDLVTENAKDRNSYSNVIYCPNDIETRIEIERDNLEQIGREVNKMCKVQTLFDLISIDQAISLGTLNCLSSEKLRSGALFIQIIQFFRQVLEMTINTKLKEDVRKFLTAAKDAGCIEQKGRRYRLVEDISLSEDEKEKKVAVTKGAKISQHKKQVEVIVSKRIQISQAKKQALFTVSKRENTSQPKKQAKGTANKAAKRNTQLKIRGRKSIGNGNFINDKKQTFIDVTNKTKDSNHKNRVKVVCKRKNVSEPKEQVEVSVSKKTKFSQTRRQVKDSVIKGGKVSKAKQQVKVTVRQGKKDSKSKQQSKVMTRGTRISPYKMDLRKSTISKRKEAK